MKISYGKFIREAAIRNLISAQERISKEGNAEEIVHITKFILKTSKKFDNQLLDPKLFFSWCNQDIVDNFRFRE